MSIPWNSVSDAVERVFGLHLREGRLPDLKRALKGAAAELGHADSSACAQLLLSGKLDAASSEVLASHLTIGETYFFRDSDAFAALSTRILPELIAARRRAGELRLRIWSAACCTGEETYSIAILLNQLLPDIADWQVTLLGTDVNPRFLRKAAEGVYGQWSFRNVPEDVRERYFLRLACGRYALLPAIRRMATFAAMNLVDESTQASVRHDVFDLILCRNVLMYFTPAQATRVVATLRRALHEDGWLAVAPCEASQSLFHRFQPAHCNGAIFYRKGRPQPRLSVAGPGHAAPTPSATVARLPLPRPAAPAPRRPAAPVALATKNPQAAASAQALAARARELADQRRMGEALGWCDRWIEAAKLDPDAHYLRGMILAETGDVSAACAAFERSLFIAPDGVMARLTLAGLERGRGREGRAALLYRNILATLEALPPDATIEYAEGVTARQLAALVRDLLQGEQA
ncbi:MAG TPA: CheR family methyltransferase [Frateuria sp.]|uniref:CheR family methyltransferase n=1 Tax=Frateuria sp. TaxID=2211372 RepID=UPI002D7F0AA1|nr:CheR family methyltransferase [Frateuria sp.]HET6803976.1 CheR family methyltransferase [Frateuria sp.]